MGFFLYFLDFWPFLINVKDNPVILIVFLLSGLFYLLNQNSFILRDTIYFFNRKDAKKIIDYDALHRSQ